MTETSSTGPPDSGPPDTGPFRCFGTGQPDYERYHDEEWGFPVRDDRSLYERISLEAFQSGLSWLTILRKRDGFRRAFCDFDAAKVAAFGDEDVARLMQDATIVRNRAKIEATMANARALVALHAAGERLTDLFWSFAPSEPTAGADLLHDLPSVTPESKALAKGLKQAGFRFVGPTTAYAAMQACGVVNDHLRACPVRAQVEQARR